MDDKIKLAAIGKLQEELGELQSALARCVIQGVGGLEPETGKPNREWLEDELADVEALTRIVTSFLNVTPDPQRIERKFNMKMGWLMMIHNHIKK